MRNVVEIPLELTHFQLPVGVQQRLDALLDRQDSGEALTIAEFSEAEGLVELAEFLALLKLRSNRQIWLTEIGEKVDAADASLARGEGILFGDAMNQIFDRFRQARNNPE